MYHLMDTEGNVGRATQTSIVQTFGIGNVCMCDPWIGSMGQPPLAFVGIPLGGHFGEVLPGEMTFASAWRPLPPAPCVPIGL